MDFVGSSNRVESSEPGANWLRDLTRSGVDPRLTVSMEKKTDLEPMEPDYLDQEAMLNLLLILRSVEEEN